MLSMLQPWCEIQTDVQLVYKGGLGLRRSHNRSPCLHSSVTLETCKSPRIRRRA